MKARTAKDRSIELLLAEDNPADVRLTQEAFQESKLNFNLSVVADGVHAVAFLRRKDNYANAPRPDLVLLDLKMPRMGGHAVLKNVKQDDELKHIPIVVLTTSDSERDVRDAYKLHANCYITKPGDFKEFRKTVQAIEEFWFRTVLLPPK